MNKIMKRIISIILILVICLPLVACGSIEVVYYTNTEVPTFTCVTGIARSNFEESGALDIYTYNCNENKKESLVTKYVNYLTKECGYVRMEYDVAIQLVDEGNGVLIDSNYEGAIVVVPYNRAD